MSLHEGDKESLLEALQNVPYVPDTVRTLENEGIFLVEEVCKLGFADILEFLIDRGVMFNREKGKVRYQCFR